MVVVPAPMTVTVFPEMVATLRLLLVYETGNPEEAVAVSAKVGSPKFFEGRELKVMTWAPLTNVKELSASLPLVPLKLSLTVKAEVSGSNSKIVRNDEHWRYILPWHTFRIRPTLSSASFARLNQLLAE